ncbi:MAG: hypothetical protein U0934_18540 [Pseudotabrizicola sp.]|uniref:hypothetical protein n=1 Tax=Pseudotabrizicola sp. TaxID=2939647 RepID=UPI00271D4C71|nr:hypothetical protein [Pseudotabrizicola sp.]MDO8882186.1 hypothetical protein [Pseudotabrizicola sp.]MDP2083275.1 hypothetical protein [Pseudotabrizicola sp.]MDZ7575922.1 hypothetical protein [Pseudotabrizicola sp.]
MHRDPKGRHLADTRAPSTGSRTAHFLRLARSKRDAFHTSHAPVSPTRLKQFLRIARGRLA